MDDPAQNNGAPHTQGPDKNVFMGMLSYLGPLVIISYLIAKNDPTVKFHIRQGLVLFVIEVGLWFLGILLWPLLPLISIIDIGILVLVIIEIINVVNGREKELPLVGGLSRHFPI